MGLTVVSVAFPFAPTGPDAVGGAEQVVSMLDEALVRAGHRSIVIACAGSTCAGELVPLPPVDDERIDDDVSHRQHEACREALASVLRRERVDVVHAHGVDFDRYVGGVDVPLVVTAHLPVAWYRSGAFEKRRPDLVVFSSHAQRRAARSLRCPSAVVGNGVRLDRFRFEREKGPGVVALGRVSPEKGFHLALDACRAAGVPLTIAGKVFAHPEHLAYFEREIVPRLDAERRFVGVVDGDARRELLARARCLLVTSLAPETTSLVAMEAMASGTPVVALRVGALPEVVADGETGVLVDRPSELPRAIVQAESIRPEACRRVAESFFDADEMFARHLELYARVARPRSRVPSREEELDLEIVGDRDRLLALEPDWRRLWEEQRDATPFTHPGWLLAAIDAFPPDRLACVVSRRTGVLQGIAPLAVTGRELHHVGRALSDYLDVVARPQAGPSFGRALSQALPAIDGWTRATLADLPEGSLLRDAPAVPGCADHVAPCNACPVIDLGAPGAIPLRRVAELEDARRRCDGRGVHVRRALDETDAHRTFDELVRLDEARWRARGQTGVLSDARVQRFHHAVVAALRGRGVVRMYRLDVQDRCLAVLYCLAAHRSVCAYFSSFDPEAALLNAGTVLVGRAIDDARAEGRRFFDFLRGREAHKYDWGARDRVTWQRVLERASAEESIGSWAAAP